MAGLRSSGESLLIVESDAKDLVLAGMGWRGEYESGRSRAVALMAIGISQVQFTGKRLHMDTCHKRDTIT